VDRVASERIQKKLHCKKMPRKRKSNTSRCTRNVKIKTQARRNESPDQTEHRSREQAVPDTVRQSLETSEQSQARLQRNAELTASRRAAETQEQSQARLQRNADFIAAQRAAETPEQSQARRQRSAELTASRRAAETLEQSQARLQRNATSMAARRAAESTEQSQIRRRQNADFIASQRAAETPEQSQARRQHEANIRASQRAAETLETAESRRRIVAERAAQRRQTFKRKNWGVFTKAAFEYDETLAYEDHVLLATERMNKECAHCGALKWKDEPPGVCCSSGKVDIPTIDLPVEPLRELFCNETDESRKFLANIRKYNSCFHMTSFGADKVVSMRGFCPTFTVQGKVYHQIGSLLPADNSQPKFLQVYFMGDDNAEIDRRVEFMQDVDRTIVQKIQHVLHEHNILVREFKTAREKIIRDNTHLKVVIHPDRVPRGQHERQFNAPTTNEIAAVIVSNEQTTSRDIVVQARDGRLSRICDTHRFYDALEYPVIFWKGQEGYNFNIPMINSTTKQPIPNKKVSCKDFYAYHLMVRRNDFNLLIRCRLLFHQFLVDMYVKMESERLRFISLNQKKLRAENYIHLQDAVRNDANLDPNNFGQLVILPSSFVNSPRYLHEYTQDAFSYVRNYGRPDLFITMTCNPTWSEITRELLPGQSSTNRHDLTARVFRLKVQKLVALLTKGNIFGETQCFMYSIEWQKRGLPHVHLLLWLKEKLRPNQIDDIICAEIPNPESDKKLYDTVSKNMIHGPCGALNSSSPCMRDGKCTKKFPKILIKDTQTNDKNYPSYRRRAPEDGGRTTIVKRASQDIEVNNSWVVPYTPLLSKIFNSHINVEYCNTVRAIKYICKYINKGSDQAIFNIRQQGIANADSRDEVETFRSARYVSSNEAAWRILGLPLHERHPTVTHLAIHLPNGQRVYFNENNFRERLATPPQTTLTAFFMLCQNDAFAKTLLYVEVPRYYTWTGKKWQRRSRGTPVEGWPDVRASDALGRIYTVHVSNFECYCLRMLLSVIRGPKNFSDLKTIDGEELSTFQQACEKMNLLEDDNHWDATIEEATANATFCCLRTLARSKLSKNVFPVPPGASRKKSPPPPLSTRWYIF